jgi:hypothetical protein
MHFTSLGGKKRLIGASQNVSQKGHKGFLCRLVFISFFIACELNFFVCRAGIIKPDYLAAVDAMANFQNFFGETVNVHQYPLFENKIMCWSGFDIPAKQFDVTSEPLAFGCGLHENSQSGNNQPSRKGNGSHPTRYVNWGELWHKLNEPSIKWTWTRFVLVSLVCFLAGGFAGNFVKLIWPAKKESSMILHDCIRKLFGFTLKFIKGAIRSVSKTALTIKTKARAVWEREIPPLGQFTTTGGAQWESYKKGEWCLLETNGVETKTAVCELLEYLHFPFWALQGEIKEKTAFLDILAPLIELGMTLPVEYIKRTYCAENSKGHIEALQWPPKTSTYAESSNPGQNRVDAHDVLSTFEPSTNSGVSPIRAGLHRCAECNKEFTVTVGTIFEDSHIPLRKWLIAWYMICSSKKGISSLQLQRNLDLGSYFFLRSAFRRHACAVYLLI